MSEVLAGRYELGDALGAGGMARVVRAHDRVLHRTVAIKLIRREAVESADPALAARFVSEARTTAGFTHRNVVTVYDAGDSDGYLYLVTEFVDGTNLAQLLAERGALDVAETVSISDQLLAALGSAHEAGIVHRDVKPANVLIDAAGTVKLADFGIAKRLDDLEASFTKAGEFVGTPRYVAPEQAAGEPATAATDLYATGVVAYEMLTGVPPYEAETPLATLLAHRDQPIPDVRQRRPEVPAAMAAAISRAMAKSPADRFASAAAMRAALGAGTAGVGGGLGAAAAGTPTVVAESVPDRTTAYPPIDPLVPAGAAAIGGAGAAARAGAPGAPTGRGGDPHDEDRGRSQAWWWVAVAVLAVVGVAALAQTGGDGGGGTAGSSTQKQAATGRTGRSTAPPTATTPAPTEAPASDAPAAPATTVPPATDPPPTDPPPTDPPATVPPTEPPLFDPGALPGDLGSLLDMLGADPSVVGKRGDDLVENLEKVAEEEDGDKQAREADKTMRELADWIERGEIDPAVAAPIEAALTPLLAGDDGPGRGKGPDEGGDD